MTFNFFEYTDASQFSNSSDIGKVSDGLSLEVDPLLFQETERQALENEERWFEPSISITHSPLVPITVIN